MATDIDTLRKRVLQAGGDYASSAASAVATRGPRPLDVVKRDMAGVWRGGVVTPPIRFSTTQTGDSGDLTPPTIRFEDPCTTSFLLASRMVHKALWDEAQASLRWLLAHEPAASATPEAKADWVILVFSWIDILVLASNLHPFFWNIPEAGLVPMCSGDPHRYCTPELLEHGGALCCGPWAPTFYAGNVCQIAGGDYAACHRSGFDAVSSRPHPSVQAEEFALRNGFRPIAGGSSRSTKCLTGFLSPRAFPGGQGLISGSGRALWLDYEVGPQTYDGGNGAGFAPIAVLQRIRADAGTSTARANDAEETFGFLATRAQLVTIFDVLRDNSAAVQLTRGNLNPSQFGGCTELWTMATAQGLLQQTRWWADYYANVNLDLLLGRAMLFYTGNHLPYFIERGILALSPSDMRDAYEQMKNAGAQQVGEMMSTVGEVMVGIVAVAVGANAILGLLVAIAVGLYTLWLAATGSTGLFDIFMLGKSFANDVPQPLFIRTMPACEARAQAMAQAESLPLATAADDLPAAPKLSPGIAILLGGIAGGLIAWAFS